MSHPLDPLTLLHELEQRDRDHARPAGPPMWRQLVEHCQDAAFQVVGVSKTELPADAVVCYALHAAQVMELGAKTQWKVVKNVATLVKQP